MLPKSPQVLKMEQKENTGRKTTRFVNVQSEELKEVHTTNAALSKMYSSGVVNLTLEGDDEGTLHNNFERLDETPKMMKHILTQSDKEYKSILFIQAMIRAYLRFGRKRIATKRRLAGHQNRRDFNIRALRKVQKLVRRFLMRRSQEYKNNYQVPLENYILTKGKRMDDCNFYIFKVF